MSKTKVSTVQEYIGWLLKQYQLLQQASQEAYRLVNIENQADKCILTVQVVGKSTTFKSAPEKIAADDKMLEQFSKKDIRTIVYYATGEIKKPRRRIISQVFSEKLNKMLFSIQKRHSKTIDIVTAAEVSMNKQLLEELHQEDAHLVGYITATEQMLEEKRQKEALKNNHSTAEN